MVESHKGIAGAKLTVPFIFFFRIIYNLYYGMVNVQTHKSHIVVDENLLCTYKQQRGSPLNCTSRWLVQSLLFLRVNASKIADRTAEIAIQRKLLSDYISMVEQAAVCADSELYSYILKAVTEGDYICGVEISVWYSV